MHTEQGRACATQVRQQRQASTKIQAAWRGRQQRQRLAACHQAAAHIQASFKALQQRQAYLQLRQAVIQMQVCCLLLPDPAWTQTVPKAGHAETHILV